MDKQKNRKNNNKQPNIKILIEKDKSSQTGYLINNRLYQIKITMVIIKI